MIITLMTDFGTKDTYVGQMKGRILSLVPNVQLIDLTHEVPFANLEFASRMLRNAVEYFPTGTIHVCVVDPGVGSSRKGIVVYWNGHYFVGPDNGVFTMLLDGRAEVREIHSRYLMAKHGNTFHGRDLFAPVAAALASGKSFIEVTSEIVFDPVHIPISVPWENNGVLVGKVWHVDKFGNMITDIPLSIIENRNTVLIDGHVLTPIYDTFSKVSSGSLVAYKGSFGYLEIGAYMSDASKMFDDINMLEVKVR